VAAECFKQQIYVHLDNHVSKAIWCCSNTDGNAWFGDTYFDVANWRRGLSYMAKHGASWGNLMSMSLRNELRSPDDDPALANSSYNWENWYENFVPAANGINAANPNVLIFLSGLNFDTDMTPIPTGADLGGGYSFHKSSFSYADKLVVEIHKYVFLRLTILIFLADPIVWLSISIRWRVSSELATREILLIRVFQNLLSNC
jgi:hypothetical protein